MKYTADSADSVFILGDLFEYWIGDDILDDDPFAARMAALMHTFSERGIALYVMHGNRDFLLGRRFMKAAGAMLLPDPSLIMAFGQRIVLAHGDAQCTADRGYQVFRRFARNRAAQWLFLAWPFRWRRALAQRMRSNSEAGRMRPASAIYDVTREGVAALFRKSRASVIIHGHTHRPARHMEPGGIRWVLPDWDLDHGKPRGATSASTQKASTRCRSTDTAAAVAPTGSSGHPLNYGVRPTCLPARPTAGADRGAPRRRLQCFQMRAEPFERRDDLVDAAAFLRRVIDQPVNRERHRIVGIRRDPVCAERRALGLRLRLRRHHDARRIADRRAACRHRLHDDRVRTDLRPAPTVKPPSTFAPAPTITPASSVG